MKRLLLTILSGVLGMALAALLAIYVMPQLTPALAAPESLESAAVGRLMDGTTSYTETATSSTYSVNSYDKVYLQVHSVITGSGTITVTPQFSSDYGACSAARYWATAMEYVIAQNPAVTDAVSMATDAESYAFTVTAGAAGGGVREIPIQGYCMRATVEFSAAPEVFTPTLMFRLVDD